MGKKKSITERVEMAYNTLAVIAQRDNWEILQKLEDGEKRHVDLVGSIRITKNNLNAHLTQLMQAGFVKKRRVTGRESYYFINKDRLMPVLFVIKVLNDATETKHDWFKLT